jgi:hypothetical protein
MGMDSVARQLGIDPYSFAKRMSSCAGILFVGLKMTPTIDLMQEAIDGIGWDGKATSAELLGERCALVQAAEWRLSAPWRPGRRACYALLTMDARGMVTVQHNAPEIGQGTHNLLCRRRSGAIFRKQIRVERRTPRWALRRR